MIHKVLIKGLLNIGDKLNIMTATFEIKFHWMRHLLELLFETRLTNEDYLGTTTPKGLATHAQTHDLFPLKWRRKTNRLASSKLISENSCNHLFESICCWMQGYNWNSDHSCRISNIRVTIDLLLWWASISIYLFEWEHTSYSPPQLRPFRSKLCVYLHLPHQRNNAFK
jgi:hypothetical protein